MKKKYEEKKGIVLNDAEGVLPNTKCKLYIQYGLNKYISNGRSTDLHHGVKLRNVGVVLKKRNQDNIKKVIVTTTDTNKTYVLFRA